MVTKYGNFDWENKVIMSKSKIHQQRIAGLEEKIKLLKEQKARTVEKEFNN